MDKRDMVCDLLSQGFDRKAVCQVAGVSPSYVSQLMADPDFQIKLQKRQTEISTSALKTDNNYDQIELEATTKILERVKQGFYKPTELLAVATMANKAGRKLGINPAGNGEEISGGRRTIRIDLPKNVPGISIVVNETNHVLDVGGTSLIPPPREVLDVLASEVVKPKLPIKHEDLPLEDQF